MMQSLGRRYVRAINSAYRRTGTYGATIDSVLPEMLF
jgi:hypothetical protein